MNWKPSIFKPKWQSSNADIRLESVSSEQDPELIGNLLEIATHDEDKRVRSAAIKRLHRLENILKLYESEADSEVKKLLQSPTLEKSAKTESRRWKTYYRRTHRRNHMTRWSNSCEIR